MDTSRRRLLGVLSTSLAGSALAGCPAGYRDDCSGTDVSAASTLPDAGGGVGPIEDPWPMRHNDAATTGFTDGAAPERDVERRRLLAVQGSFFPSVVVGDGRLYVTSRAGELLAVDPAGPTVEWRYGDLEAGGASAAVADDLVLVATRNGLHAVEASTGDRRWVREEQLDGEELLLVEAGTAYAATPEHVLGVDVGTGEVDWRVTAESLGAVADGRAYLATGGGLAVVGLDDGRVHWRDDEVEGGAVAVRDGTAYAAGGAQWGHIREDPGVLVAFDAADGTREWTFDSERTQGLLSPAVAPDAVAVADGYGGTVHVLDRADGERRWCASYGARHVTTPVVAADVVYVLADDVLQARRLADGEALWTHRVDPAERESQDEEEPGFYHHHAVSGGALLAAGYGRDGVVVDAFLEP